MSANVPHGWHKTRLRHVIGSLDAGVSVNSGDCPSMNGEPGVLKTSCVTTGTFRPNENKVVVQGEIAFAKESPSKGGIIISRMNTSALVGASGYVDRDWPHLFLPDRLWQAKVADNNKYRPRWLAYLLASDQMRLVLGQRATGTSGSMKNLSKEALLSIKVDVPPPEEQDFIVDTLYCWDCVIEIVDQLLVEKRLRHKVLMQQLLTGKRRLSKLDTPWNTLKLKSILSPVQRQISKPLQPYDALGIRSHFKGTFAKQIEDPMKIDMDTLYIAKAGDLIVNITFAWEGAIAIVPPEHDGRLVSHRFPTYRPKEQKVSTEYLRYLISQERFKYLLAGISPGGAGRNRVMSKKGFLLLEITIPDLAEQKKVAAILDTASREIDLLQNKADALREQKKGLMQQLLTGKKRVKGLKGGQQQ